MRLLVILLCAYGVYTFASDQVVAAKTALVERAAMIEKAGQ